MLRKNRAKFPGRVHYKYRHGSQRLEAEFPEIYENFRKYAILARKRHGFEEKYMFLKGPISGNPEISGTLGALSIGKI